MEKLTPRSSKAGNQPVFRQPHEQGHGTLSKEGLPGRVDKAIRDTGVLAMSAASPIMLKESTLFKCFLTEPEMQGDKLVR